MKHLFHHSLRILVLIVFALGPLAWTLEITYATGLWYVAPSGSDSNSCSVPIAPCASINAAIAKASAGDTIRIATGEYFGTGAQVVLITKDLTLSGGWNLAFAEQVGWSTIDGQASRRGVAINAGVKATATRLIVQNARTSLIETGAGVSNQGTLTLTDSIVRNNVSINDSSGGIYNSGVLTVTNTLVSNNIGWCGGGIRSVGVELNIVDSDISYNRANGPGGGMCVEAGQTQVRNSAIVKNVSYRNGGGFYVNQSVVAIANSTISGNSAGFGGGIYSWRGNLAVSSSTLTANNGTVGGGIHGSEMRMRNSILASNESYNSSTADCVGSGFSDFVSEGNNIVGNTCNFTLMPGDQHGVDPRLAPLTESGGYHALLLNSPAINAGDSLGCRDHAGVLLSADQRHMPRVGRCDIGAYEAGLEIAKTVTGSLTPGGVANYRIQLSNAEGQISLDGVALTDTLPSALNYVAGSLNASNGNAAFNGSVLTWSGVVVGGSPTVISFETVIEPAVVGQPITNVAVGYWAGAHLKAAVTFTPLARVYLPLTTRNYCPDFFDDFSNPASGWLSTDNSLGRFGYLNGEYQMLSRQAGYLFLIRAPACPRENYLVEADFRWNGNTGSDLGLIFGLQGDFDRFYYFVFNTDYQAFALYRFEPDHVITLISPRQSGAIRPGNAINRARATRNGSQISLAMNGVAIGWTYDNAISGLGHAGLAMSPYDDVPVADARVDNFRFSSLPGLLQASAAPAALPALDHQPSAWTPNLDAVREGRK